MKRPEEDGADKAGVTAIRVSPHVSPYSDLVESLETDIEDGLTSERARVRMTSTGPNEMNVNTKIQPGRILLRQVANAMTLVLILAMGVSFGIKSWIEGGCIAGVIFINVAFGWVEEFKAEKTLSSLRSLSSPTANVVRDGKVVQIPTREVVPGDMIELKTGDTVPADMRLVEATNLALDETLLTGESLPMEKIADQVFAEDVGLSDRLNIAYSSTNVAKGRGRGIAYATGMNTQIGLIAAALRASGSRRRPVKRKADGSAGPHRHAQAWGLTLSDAVGTFLGINVGTPLQKKLSRLAIVLFGVAVICAIIVLSANRFTQYNDLQGSDHEREIAIYAVATGLSMIPASLVVILTITMSAGTQQMARRRVVVRKLNALEALGGISDICSDKTGTLTLGRMVAQKAWIPEEGIFSVTDTHNPESPEDGRVRFRPVQQSIDAECENQAEETEMTLRSHVKRSSKIKAFVQTASLANLADVHQSSGDSWHARGEPTEIAIQVFAARFGWNRRDVIKGQNTSFRHLAEFPFSSDVKMMSVICQEMISGRIFVHSKGAVERILDRCTHMNCSTRNEEPVELDAQMREEILHQLEVFADSGLRCLALASKTLLDIPDGENYTQVPRGSVESGLTFNGLIGIYDAPRPESLGAVESCHRAGVAVHMLTGDHIGTARAIAKQVGIIPHHLETRGQSEIDAMIMAASDFDALSDQELDVLPLLPLVVARCAPQTKVRMIEALHRRAKFCAMTGDGVNDSPSLNRADVGIAMGASGSDVAKDASDIILTDDNFASIVNAVEEGRRVFDNIQKFVLHLLSLNIAQACVLLIGLAFKDTRNVSVFPLSPVQILWLIMITSSLPDMGLGFEIAEANILERPPVSLKKGIFSWEIVVDMFFYGLWLALICLASFSIVLWGFGTGELGSNCNTSYTMECDAVFRARGTNFAVLTWCSLLLAWEMIEMRRSFFRMRPGSKRPLTQWMSDVWRNKMLFWTVIIGFILTFPLLYIPVINHALFNHEGISWEWSIVFLGSLVFLIGVEVFKYGKRIFFRHISTDKAPASSDDARTIV